MLTNLLQLLIGFLVGLFSMVPSGLPGLDVIVRSVLVIGGLRNLLSQTTSYFGAGVLAAVAAPFVVRYGRKAYVWAHAQWTGYTKDSEGRVIVDAIGVVVH